MRLLITGISGRLGVNLGMLARDRYRVAGCYLHNPVAIEGVEIVHADLTRHGVLDELVRQLNPDVIVHTAGLTNVDVCEENPVLARRLNVDVAAEVARVAGDREKQLVHLSTDHVFSGTQAWHDEVETPAPVNVYAQTKTDAETAVLDVCPQALIIRTNFYGWGPPKSISFSDWIVSALERGETLGMFTDVFFTPILMNDLAEIILELVAAGACGLYHVAGGERLSKYDFARRIADVFSLSPTRIQPTSVEEVRLQAARPKDMSLRTDKVARFLGRQMPTANEGLKRLRWLRENGWPHAVDGVHRSSSVGARG